MSNTIAAVVPVHPPRIENGMLSRCLASIYAQSTKVAELCIAVDRHKEGSRETRKRAIRMAQADWIAPIDADDEWLPEHLEKLLALAEAESADYVYPWYEVIGGTDPRPYAFGQPFDPVKPSHHPSCILVRTYLAQEAITHLKRKDEEKPPLWSDDFALLTACMNLGAKIVHLRERTWRWHHHGQNSSGVPGKGDA